MTHALGASFVLTYITNFERTRHEEKCLLESEIMSCYQPKKEINFLFVEIHCILYLNKHLNNYWYDRGVRAPISWKLTLLSSLMLFCNSETFTFSLLFFFCKLLHFALWMQLWEFLGVHKLDPCRDDVDVVKTGVEKEKSVTWLHMALADEGLIVFSTLHKFANCRLWADVEGHESAPSGNSRLWTELKAVAISSSTFVELESVEVALVLLL